MSAYGGTPQDRGNGREHRSARDKVEVPRVKDDGGRTIGIVGESTRGVVVGTQFDIIILDMHVDGSRSVVALDVSEAVMIAEYLNAAAESVVRSDNLKE